MAPFCRSTRVFFLVLLCSHTKLALSQQSPDLTQKEDDLMLAPEKNPLDALGTEDVAILKSSWGLTVNNQCLYEFVYKFEHNPRLPIGDDSFRGKCNFGDLKAPKEPRIAPDGIPYLHPRRFYERFPNYVWATMGFNHLSVDWLPCGRRPAGYKTAQYDMSFFRVTPEFRAETMTCKLKEPGSMTIVPGEEFCDTEQDDPNGMNFFVVPASVTDREPVVNMPKEFTHKDLTDAPLPHIGLRSWNKAVVPEQPGGWNDVPAFMSSYAGKTVMWQAHIPYKLISGNNRQFRSNADRYYETTIPTMPDTWSVKYDEVDGTIEFTMVGNAQLCRGDFDRAQEAAGGPPVFPVWVDPPPGMKPSDDEGGNPREGRDGGDGGTSGSSDDHSFRTMLATLILQSSVFFFAM